MSTIVTGNLLNPSAQGLSFGMYPAGSMSQYMEDASVFTAPYANVGFGALNPNYYNAMGVASDNMTALAFKTRSNQHVLGSYNEIMQKNLTEMATAIREGEMGKASQIYNEVYQAISQNYGEELTTQSQRVAFDQSVKATITNLYQQINGYPLSMDIKENGEGYFANGFMQGLTLGNHHKNSAEEIKGFFDGKDFNKEEIASEITVLLYQKFLKFMLGPTEPVEKLDLSNCVEAIAEVLCTLSPRERDVLRIRFGMDDGRMRTLEEVGQLFGVKRDEIELIEAKALRKLRHPNRVKTLKEFLQKKQKTIKEEN